MLSIEVRTSGGTELREEGWRDEYGVAIGKHLTQQELQTPWIML